MLGREDRNDEQVSANEANDSAQPLQPDRNAPGLVAGAGNKPIVGLCDDDSPEEHANHHLKVAQQVGQKVRVGNVTEPLQGLRGSGQVKNFRV